jgi:aminocarboxymuconate-semialdehyde decarboxylase
VFSTLLLSRLVEDVGADHLLLGTDHPFELGDRAPLQTVRDLGLSPADTAAVLGGSAAASLGVRAAAAGSD